MTIEWSDSPEHIDWDELSALYRAAPLGDKKPQHLQTVFGNSRFTCFARDAGRLVERSRGHRKIILYAVPGKEPFYRRFGFLRMKTAMAIFENPQQQLERGYLSDT